MADAQMLHLSSQIPLLIGVNKTVFTTLKARKDTPVWRVLTWYNYRTDEYLTHHAKDRYHIRTARGFAFW